MGITEQQPVFVWTAEAVDNPMSARPTSAGQPQSAFRRQVFRGAMGAAVVALSPVVIEAVVTIEHRQGWLLLSTDC